MHFEIMGGVWINRCYRSDEVGKEADTQVYKRYLEMHDMAGHIPASASRFETMKS